MTDRDKQIEEMVKTLSTCECDCLNCKSCYSWELCEALYNAGYRKAEDVAREIFEEIEKEFGGLMNEYHKSKRFSDADVIRYAYYLVDELKKKYENLNSWVELTHTCHHIIPNTIESIADIAFAESEGEG